MSKSKLDDFSIRCAGCERLETRKRFDFHPHKVEYLCMTRWLGFAPFSTPTECPKQQPRPAAVDAK
jgi:hypothetical protein